MIGIVNYGLGNLHAFLDCYRILGIAATEVSDPGQVGLCSKLILPGVGSFDTAMRQLNSSGLREPLDELARSGNLEILGVCVGLQMLFSKSSEGNEAGLGWIDGDVQRFDHSHLERVRVPHMGWNTLEISNHSGLFDQIYLDPFYFLHSYFVVPADSSSITATCQYGNVFAAAVQLGTVSGVQFHPEKSHQPGLQLLKNFASS